jgi:hypothetical protein
LSSSGKRASIFYRPAAVRQWVVMHEMAQLPEAATGSPPTV